MSIFEAIGNQAARSAVDAGMKHFGEPTIKDLAEKGLNKLREEDPWSDDALAESLKEFQLNPDQANPQTISAGPGGAQNEERASIPVTHLREKLVWMSQEENRMKLRENRLKEMARKMEEVEHARKMNYKKAMAEVKKEKMGMLVTCAKWGLAGGLVVWGLSALAKFSNERGRLAASRPRQQISSEWGN